MNRRLIIKMLGALLIIEAAAMLPALVVALGYGEEDALPLLKSIGINLLAGACMCFIPKKDPDSHLRLKEGFIITALGWILLGVFGAVPFMLSGTLPRFEEAFFETVSGLTTTGASVFTQETFDSASHGIFFWRATTHWIGGMGVLVLTLALLPKLTGRTSHLVRAESPGPSLSKLVPKTGTTAKILYKIYILLSFIEFVVLMICGMSPFDAAVHTMATAGTGGFSSYGKSIAQFDSVPIEIVITVFMFMFGVNFALYYRFLIGERFKAFFRDEEFRWYFIFAVGFMLLVTVINLDHYHGDFLTSLRYGSFQISSIMSTTGFVTYDFNTWPAASQIIIVMAMLIGSCAGSTAGGIKVIRIILLTKLSRRNIRSTGQPKKMDVIRLDGKAVDEHMLSQIAQFAFMYICLVIAGGFIMSLGSNYDLTTNMSAALTCVSNVGPGLGAVGPVYNYAGYTVHAKITASFLMLFGRLELLPLFILFTRSAWHKY